MHGEPADRSVFLRDGRIGWYTDAGGVDVGVVRDEVVDGYDVQVDHSILRQSMEHTGRMPMYYQGPAAAVAPGLAIPVVVDLRIEYQSVGTVDGSGWVMRERGRKEWLGSIETTGDGAWGIFNADSKLRLPDGREGTFVTTSASSDGRVEIQGTGPAPFRDEADELAD